MFDHPIAIALVRKLGRALLALLLLPAWPALADISATIDRNPVDTGETFVLSFRADGDGGAEPDFSPLERDFEIVNRSQSSQFSFSNGQANRTTEWQLALMPKHDGMLAIPAIDFGGERSKPLTVTVRAAAHRDNAAEAGQNLVVEMEAEPKNPYVQAQAVLSVRVLGRQAFGGNLSDPQADNVLIEKLGDDRRFSVTRDGVAYTAIERKYALFPQKSGRLHLDPVTLNAEISDGRPQFGGFLGRGTHSVRLQSQPIDLDVRPIPPAMTGKSWLPAESLELSDSWEQGIPRINVGEPVTRTLTAVARGSTVGVLPELARDPGSAVRHYPDQPVLNEEKHPDGITSSRQEKTALIVATPGSVRLPPVEVHWWNTRTDREEVARIPERTLSVASTANQSQPAPAQTPPSSLTEPEPNTVSPPAIAPGGDTPTTVPGSPGFWPYLALGLGIGWVSTLGAWLWTSRRRATRIAPAADAKPATDAASERAMRQQLEQACRAADPAAARSMLIVWLAHRWKLPPEQIPAALRQRGSAPLADAFSRLDAGLFGPAGATPAWQGGELWAACQSLEAVGKPTANETLNPLEPLHRLPT